MLLKDIIAALPKLSQSDLAAVRAAADHLLTGKVDDLDHTIPLFDAMTRLLGVRRSYRDFHRSVAYKTWRRTAPTALAFIDEAFPEATRVAKVAIMNMLLEALIEEFKERNWLISLVTVTRNLDRFEQVFENEFPGYLKSGLAHLVLESMLKRGSK